MKTKIFLNARRLMLAGLAMLTIGVSQGWATWTRVTTVGQITTGGTFIIGYEADYENAEGVLIPLRAEGGTATTSATGFLYSGTSAGSTTTGTIDMSSIVSTSDYEVTIVTGASSGTISIQLRDGNYIGNNNTKNKCKLYASVCAETSFTPTIGADDVVTLELDAAVSEDYPKLQYNSGTGNQRFACYNGGQKNLVLYKKAPDVTHTVRWFDTNGQFKSESITEGSTSYSCPSPAPTTAANCGDKFMGWTTSSSYKANTPPTVLFTDDSGTKPAINADTDFYAVFADEE